jgi:hypothetical protein
MCDVMMGEADGAAMPPDSTLDATAAVPAIDAEGAPRSYLMPEPPRFPEG